MLNEMEAGTVPPSGAAPRKGLATTSLILGLLANLGLWCLAGIPAIIIGHIALGRARRFPQTYGGARLAIAGFTLGYLSLLIGGVVTALWVGQYKSAVESEAQPEAAIRRPNRFNHISLAARFPAD